MYEFVSLVFFLAISAGGFGQSIEEPLLQEKMKKDLSVFKEIRLKVNSGLYKYRSEEQIDSIYNWANNEINTCNTYLDFSR